MDCGRAREMLAAYHDGELGAGERVLVEEHLRGCGECSAILERLKRVDANVDVPDPGAEYWERFNRRVMERVDREAAPTRAPRPERRWMRRLPYFVPAAAAAALLVVVLRQAGMDPFSRTAQPPAPVSPPEIASQAPPREAKEPPAALDASRRPEAPPAAKPVYREKANEAPPPAEAPGSVAPAAADAHGPPAVLEAESFRKDAASGGAASKGGAMPESREEKALPEPAARQPLSKSTAAAVPPAVAAPCPEARELADRGRLGEAESAQRACLARAESAQAREAGMIFLAELLDRQSRFPEADKVIEAARREFPGSRPLDEYLRRRPQVRGRP